MHCAAPAFALYQKGRDELKEERNRVQIERAVAQFAAASPRL